VVRGLVDTIKKHRPYVYCEILDINDDSDKLQRKNELCGIMVEMNYQIFGLKPGGKFMELISDIDRIGRDYLGEYIFCPKELHDQFLSEIKNNSSGVNV